MSVVMRVSEELHESAKKIAGMRGLSPAEVVDDAWREYVETHSEELAADFEHAAHLIREGDTAGLAELASRSAGIEAERTADGARR